MSEFDFNQIRRLDGGLLLVFRELLRRRRASEVAKTLGLTPSAVSHSLARLRDLFEDPLFIRRPHGLEPTRRALELGPRIEGLIEMAGQTLSSRAEFEPARSGRQFRVAAAEFVTAVVGAPLINALRRDAPGASLVMAQLSQAQAMDALRRGEIDLALGRFSALPQGVVSSLLFHDRYCTVARRDHPTIHGSLTVEEFHRTGHIFAHAATETGVEPDSADMVTAMIAAVPGWLTALSLVAATDAIATCSERLARRQADLLGLQILNPPFEMSTFEVDSVCREGVDPGVQWLLQVVRAAVD